MSQILTNAKFSYDETYDHVCLELPAPGGATQHVLNRYLDENGEYSGDRVPFYHTLDFDCKDGQGQWVSVWQGQYALYGLDFPEKDHIY